MSVQPISRVLSNDLLFGRSFLLGYDHSDPLAAYPRRLDRGGHTPRRLFGLAPTGVYRATCVTTCAVSSYLAVSPLPDPACGLAIGGLFSVVLSVVLRRPDVIWRPVLWSPDFPRLYGYRSRRDHPAAHPQYSLSVEVFPIGIALQLSNLDSRSCPPNGTVLCVIECAI